MSILFDKPDAPAAPDFTPFIQAAQATAASDAEAARINAEVAREQLAKQDVYAQRSADLADKYYNTAVEAAGFNREQYNNILPYLQQYMDSQVRYTQGGEANLVEQLAAAKLSRQQATETYDRYKSEFAPRETQFLQEAYDYASPERQAQAAAEARGDVATAFGAQREKATRDLAGYGIDPTQGRYAGATQAMDISQAAAGAAAGTLARREVEQQGKQYEVAALQMGQKLPTQAIGLGTLGVNQGSGAFAGGQYGGGGVGAATNALGTGAQAYGSPTSYAGLSNPYTSLAGAYGNQGVGLYGAQASNLGNVAGALGVGAGALGSGFNAQMDIYRQESANAMAPWQAIGKIAGAAVGGWAGGGFKI